MKNIYFPKGDFWMTSIQKNYKTLLFTSLAALAFSCSNDELIDEEEFFSVSENYSTSVTIQNAGFESGESGWLYNSDTATSSSTPSNGGSISIKVKNSGKRVGQVVNVTANTDYTLTAMMLGKGKIGAGSSSSSIEDYSSWTEITYTFNSGSSTNIEIFGHANEANVRFDNFTLNSNGTPPSTTPPSGGDVTILNSGFESGETDWLYNSDTAPSSSAPANGGSASIKVKISGKRVGQVVSVSANTNYTLTAMMYGKGKIGAGSGSSSIEDFNSWDAISYTFNSGSSTSIEIFGHANEDNVRFDNFVLNSGGTPPSTTPPPTGGSNPSDLLALDAWKITFPLDENGDDSRNDTWYEDRNMQAEEMQGSDIVGPIASPYNEYFYVSGDEVFFKAHVGAATTSGSKYTRSELRQLVKNSSGNRGANYWSMNKYQKLDVRVRATHLPNIKPEVSMVQIHGPDDEPLRVEYNAESSDKLHVVWNEKNTFKDVLDYSLGEQLRVIVTVDNGDVTCKIINESRGNATWQETWTSADDTGYFKVGCYTQSSMFINQFKLDGEGNPIWPVNPAWDEYGEVAVKDMSLVETWQ